ncbi:endoglucanase 1 [Pyricularia oryzae]|uniref:Glucanase n=3 Tax=Pyricularia TaxID=48558 RepID=A0ABQ8NCC9_PYRGI|nr:endoglucanase 1 [Pyricularia oryzae 70-15]ELQ34345.1 endoglucanase 1 [Pyricularia oryzae Y34]KAH8846388.1 endoglucanase 1 [Pyricularia oryzae]KAI6294822.1 endoglucanase 1 [Pyricularia grisea]EHA47928.1 endoglucanase 1 [Pyricularia oryzae 70-15]KAH9432098.1 endoglucanase 1 [Pyricularia oryzae]
MTVLLTLALLGSLVAAQKPVGTEVHPKITTYRCTKEGGCTEKTNYIVIDSLAHHVFQPAAPSYGCGGWGEAANATACPTKEACHENCHMQGQSDYSNIGVTTSGSSLRLQHIMPNGNVVSPRVYLLDETEHKYEMLQLTGNEFTFDVVMNQLPCGMNSALYLSEMEADGGKSDINEGGAYWGTGYCDAQCYTTPFINGEGNLIGAGSCCNEMDIWEANSRSAHIAPHPCNVPGLVECTGAACGGDSAGICDKPGCAWNSYRNGSPNYYGRDDEFKVDSTKPMTVVTQFPTGADGKLEAIRRLYVQDGVVIRAERVKKEGLPAVNELNDELCRATNSNRFLELGAHAGMGDALSRGMVLALSIWWDEGGYMQWLDGANDGAGPCNATEGAPSFIRQVEPYPEVTFSNMKWGEIDSTYEGKERCVKKRSTM